MGEHAFPLTGFVCMAAHVTFGGSGGMGNEKTIISGLSRAGKGVPGYVALASPSSLLCAIGNFGTKSRVEGEKCNRFRYKYHFYSLAVEAGFYGDCSRVVGSFTKLSNGERG